MSQCELKGTKTLPLESANPARWFSASALKPALVICTGLPVLSAPVVISSACSKKEKAPALLREFTTYRVPALGSITGVPTIPALPLISTHPEP